ncbi:MAG: ATP-binding protein [Okeania sp. SIO2G4]|nr:MULTISPECIES: ATP-binding protein [unclassified Okeania]NEP37810.1 ATP-binding protein [Okeania sp. SIO2H7]NEP72351.1 ATP-binding protein [Okeania sp. SIO2G5]NEP94315.1 ATP-binding protein [Okeania sp. SIO2F5]NEQ91034.1 ATP-binding protein [Okeania sp. SIO2G4]
MSEPSSAYINDIGGDVKGIIGDGDIKGIIGDIKGGVVNQYIIAQYSEAEIHSRNLKPGSPYLGLNKFQPGDKDKFFGRERWIIELSNDLEKSNLLLLVGASGSGKSSLVQAGLIPYLSDQWGASQLVTIIFVPDNNPFTSFSDNFPKKYQNKASDFFNSPNNLTLIDVIKRCQ